MNQTLPTLLSATGGQSFLQELWSVFYETSLKGNAEYENLSLGSDSLISVRTVIFGLFIGLTVAIFFSVFQKRTLRLLIQRLQREGCVSPETGKSLPQLGLADKLWIRRSLRNSVSLRRVVRCREEEDFLAQLPQEEQERPRRRRREAVFSVNPDDHHFYIPEEQRYAAELRYDKKGTSWLGAFGLMFVLLIAFVAFLAVLPYILQALDDFVGSLKSTGSGNILT